MSAGEKLYDVVAVGEGMRVRLLERNKTQPNAEAIERMAILRRGCDEEFFATVSAGRYKEGDEWQGEDEVEQSPALSPQELRVCKAISARPGIIANRDGARAVAQDLVNKGYCKVSRARAGPLGLYTGEMLLSLTDAGRQAMMRAQPQERSGEQRSCDRDRER